MQRKNNILKKRAFALVSAIVIIVVFSIIMAFSLKMNAKTSKRVVDSYIKNQAELYAKNAAEYSLYKISKASSNCLPKTIKPFSIDGLYDVNISLSYAYSNVTCDNNYILLKDAPDKSRQYGYVKIDIIVSIKNNSLNSEPIRIYRSYLEDITPYLK
jgi:competence protein ComGC